MESCKITWIDDKTVKFSGVFDEYATFDDVVSQFPDEVWLDFLEVSRVNSLGVKEWIKSISLSQSRLHYINCPSIIVDQFNMIPEFLGSNASIDSFEVYFACDECGHEDKRFYSVGDGKDINPDTTDLDDFLHVNCIRCGADMELDHDPEIYFNFIREMADKAG